MRRETDLEPATEVTGRSGIQTSDSFGVTVAWEVNAPDCRSRATSYERALNTTFKIFLPIYHLNN